MVVNEAGGGIGVQAMKRVEGWEKEGDLGAVWWCWC